MFDAAGRAHEETTLECASIDMPVLKVRPDLPRYAGFTAIFGPVTRRAALNSCDG
jgi:hypothetical protein